MKYYFVGSPMEEFVRLCAGYDILEGFASLLLAVKGFSCKSAHFNCRNIKSKRALDTRGAMDSHHKHNN